MATDRMPDPESSELQFDPVKRDVELLIATLRASMLGDFSAAAIDAELAPRRQQLEIGAYHREVLATAERIARTRGVNFDPAKFGTQDVSLKSVLLEELGAVQRSGYNQALIDAECWVLQFCYDHGFYQPGASPLLRRRPGVTTVQMVIDDLDSIHGTQKIPVLVKEQPSEN